MLFSVLFVFSAFVLPALCRDQLLVLAFAFLYVSFYETV